MTDTNTMICIRKSIETTTTMMPNQARLFAQTNKMKTLLLVCFCSTMVLIIGPQRYLSEINNYDNSIKSMAYSYSYSTIDLDTTRNLSKRQSNNATIVTANSTVNEVVYNSVSSSSLATNSSSRQQLQLQSQSQNHHTKQPKPKLKPGSPNTAVIISSSWIPTHPSTDMIDTVLKSVRNKLIGLNTKTTPIFITVDALPQPDYKNIEHDNKIKTIDMYITKLYKKYLLDPQIHIIINQEHHHIGGSVWKVLQQIKYHYSGSIKYLYYVQHDFEFIQQIDHQALIETMNNNNNNNNVHHHYDENENVDAGVNYVLFEYRYNRKRDEHSSSCDGRNKVNIIPSSLSTSSVSTTTSPLLPLSSNNNNSSSNNNSNSSNNNNNTSSMDASSAHLCKSCKYSDNNHLVKFDWYYKYIGGMGSWKKRPPENPIQVTATNSCNELGLYIYKGNNNPSLYALRHLDGRGTTIKPKPKPPGMNIQWG